MNRLTVLSLVACAMGIAGCSGGQGTAQTEPQRVGADDRIVAVAKSWREMTQSEGYPNLPDVAFMRVMDSTTLRLEAGSAEAIWDVQRDELLRSPDGREFHCEVSGAIRSIVRFGWRMDEATVVVRVPGSTLPRRCREQGFARRSKRFEPLNVTYVLRGDRLVAIRPLTVRSSLLPID